MIPCFIYRYIFKRCQFIEAYSISSFAGLSSASKHDAQAQFQDAVARDTISY